MEKVECSRENKKACVHRLCRYFLDMDEVIHRYCREHDLVSETMRAFKIIDQCKSPEMLDEIKMAVLNREKVIRR